MWPAVPKAFNEQLTSIIELVEHKQLHNVMQRGRPEQCRLYNFICAASDVFFLFGSIIIVLIICFASVMSLGISLPRMAESLFLSQRNNYSECMEAFLMLKNVSVGEIYRFVWVSLLLILRSKKGSEHILTFIIMSPHVCTAENLHSFT